MMKLSRTSVRLTSFWPLLVIVAILAAIVFKLSPQNLSILPYKCLIVCLAVYVSHRIDEIFFPSRTSQGWGSALSINRDLARAIVYGATVVAFAVGL